MNQKSGVWQKIKRNRDLCMSIAIALVLTIIAILIGYINSYIKFHLDSTLIQVFGTLLGLAVTSFGIIMTLLPNLDKTLLKSDTFDDVVRHFLYLVILEVIVIILGLIIYSSLSGLLEWLNSWLIAIQLYLSFLSTLMTVYATFYIYYLFKAIKKQRLEKE
jgi:hypothetical protein